MATPKKLNIFFGFPSYGGNGGISCEVPDIRKWYARVIQQCAKDPRIDQVFEETIGDTPVTMVRNRFVKLAREAGADVLVMCDSDQHPDKHVGEGGHKDWFTTSFDFLYNHHAKGPCVIGAPYCGPPGGTENVYVFRWENYGVRGPETPFALVQYTRGEVFNLAGIQPVAALPTGLIMYDLRCFDLIEPSKLSRSQVLDELLGGKITKDEALSALRQGFFDYEWKDGYADEKASTEDVQNTRDICLAGQAVLGYNPVYCNWDSWIGHWKPWCVGKPAVYCTEQIAANFQQAVTNKQSIWERVYRVDNQDLLERMLAKNPNTVDLSRSFQHAEDVTNPGKGSAVLQVGMGMKTCRVDPPAQQVTLQAADGCGSAVACPPPFPKLEG